MWDKFKQLGELKKIRDQAMALKKSLAAEEIVVEEGEIRVVISGEQKIKALSIRGETSQALIDVLNKAIKKSQKLAAKKLQQMGSNFGLSGFSLK